MKLQPPEPPKTRIICEFCGDLENGKHASFCSPMKYVILGILVVLAAMFVLPFIL